MDWFLYTWWDYGLATRVVGSIVFAATAVACGCAAWRLRGRRRAKGWVGLTLLYALMTLEIQYGWRFAMAAWGRGISKGEGWYFEHRVVQAFVVAAVLLGAVAVLLAIWGVGRSNRRAAKRNGPWRLALSGTLIAVLALLMETVSLHQVEHLLYTHTWPVLLVAWLWILGAAASAIGAMLA